MVQYARSLVFQLSLAALLASTALASDHLDPAAVAQDPAVDIADIYAFVGGTTDFGGEVGIVPNAVIVMTLVGHPELDVQYSFLFDLDPPEGRESFEPDSRLNIWFTPHPTNADGTPWCLNFELGALAVSSCLNPAWYNAETDSYNINVPLVDILGAGAVQIFGGLRDDPFFFDLVNFNAAVEALVAWSETYCDEGGICECNGGPTDNSCRPAYPVYGESGYEPLHLINIAETGVTRNTFADGDVYAFVIEAPARALGSETIASYAATYRRAATIRTPRGDIERGPWIQMDRLAVPALSTGLLSGDELKLLFNRDDVNTSYAAVLGASIDGIRLLATRALGPFHQTDNPVPVLAPTTEDLLTLIDPDIVQLDLRGGASPPFPNFPNGRTLSADVMDGILTLVFGLPTTDGIGVGGESFIGTFPYLGPPNE